MAKRGFHSQIIYQPATRFWAFQGIEAGIFVVLAAALIALTWPCPDPRRMNHYPAAPNPWRRHGLGAASRRWHRRFAYCRRILGRVIPESRACARSIATHPTPTGPTLFLVSCILGLLPAVNTVRVTVPVRYMSVDQPESAGSSGTQPDPAGQRSTAREMG
jgi:hypothetical protein